MGSVPTAILPQELPDTTARVVFVPVRHHSPACARMVRELARELRPDAVLIEGPSDFNDRMAELLLPHRLPIAIYTYARLGELRRGAYYPFCAYSPEWQAIQTAGELGIPARFIDLPWSGMAAEEPAASHLYADGELRFSDYVKALCERVGVQDFDTLWDTLFEIDRDVPARTLLERCHHYCAHARELDRHVSELDLRREAFMAQQVRSALEEFEGQVMVVTGGFHSRALLERLRNPDAFPPLEPSRAPAGELETGIALTPYSYERLDSLTGYDSGMPNPGFYHHVWQDREAGRGETHRRLLREVVAELRRRGQRFSTADLIAVETTAQALASLRGHAEVWRADLLDGILGALVKDDLEAGGRHPFLDAVHAVFRGGERGRLAEGAGIPPLVADIQRAVQAHDLEPKIVDRSVDVDLAAPEGLARSRVLHRLAGLDIPGYVRTGGTDLTTREDLSTLTETWRIRWSPEFEAGCVEASLYGSSLEEAAAARLRELADGLERDAAGAALLLLRARLMGLPELAPGFHDRLVRLIREDGAFEGVTGALGHLLYLYRYDDLLGGAGDARTGELLAEAWSRGLWLLESMGRPQEEGKALLDGIKALIHTHESCGHALDLGREELLAVLGRIAGEDAQTSLMRGAASGALWSLGEADPEAVLAGITFCAAPDRLGDYLTGLFYLARETVQRHPELVLSIDGVLAAYSDEAFLEALPALRLAFSFFTPREKHYMAGTLLEALGLAAADPLAGLEVGPEVAAQALAVEAQVMRMRELYGLRGGHAGG